MCGIFAAVRLEGHFTESEIQSFDTACERIAHRGPDASGRLLTCHGGDVDADPPNLYLGHRRLSILDLDEAANQPFSRDGLHMVYNGEVFNYLELASDRFSEFPFETSSDTEVVLRAYQKYGAECFAQFNGMWALAIYDARRQKLVLARDRFSIKPLYMMQMGDTWYFASEIKQLRAVQGARFTPDIGSIHAFLNQALINHQANTFYQEVKRFPAMHALEIDLQSGQLSWHKYWDYAPADEALKGIPPERIATHFRDLLIDSLRLRLRSDVPVGTLLSGGLDSSAISTLIHEHIKPDVMTFSVVSDDKAFSEEPFIDALVLEKGIPNEKLRFHTGLAMEHLDTVLEMQDEPYGSLAVVAQYLLFQQIKRETGITVLLSGQGADEVLLGYSKFFFFELRSRLKQMRLGSAVGMAAASWRKGTTVRDFDLREAKRYLPWARKRGQDYLPQGGAGEALWTFEDMRSRQMLDIDHYSVPALTQYEDRNSMAASIEVRLPFLDFRIVDFLVNVPVEYKLRDGWTKHLLREAVPELPDAISWRRDKKGFTTPEATWMRGELGAEIIRYMSTHRRLEDLGIVDNGAFCKAVESYRNGAKWISHGDLFRVYITERWLSGL